MKSINFCHAPNNLCAEGLRCPQQLWLYMKYAAYFFRLNKDIEDTQQRVLSMHEGLRRLPSPTQTPADAASTRLKLIKGAREKLSGKQWGSKLNYLGTMGVVWFSNSFGYSKKYLGCKNVYLDSFKVPGTI